MSPVLEMPQGTAPKEKNHYGNKKPWALLLVAMVLCLGLAIFFLLQGRIINTQNSISAVLIPVASPLSVAYTDVFATHGMQVQKGMPLARLDLSEYARHIPHAQALVRGAQPSAQAALAQSAQQNEAEMVMTIAVARQEEKAKHDLIEKLSVAHARALLQMRSQADGSAEKRQAQAAEKQAKLQLEQAKSAHELASRNRAAVEHVLQQLRAQRQAHPSGQGTQGTSINTISGITEQLLAPVQGHIVGDIPLPGQVFQKGSPVFMILPSEGTQLKAVAHMPPDEARQLNMATPVFLHIQNTVLRASLQQISHDETISVVSLVIDAQIDAQEEGFDTLMLALQEKKARLVFWPQTWAQDAMPENVLAFFSHI